MLRLPIENGSLAARGCVKLLASSLRGCLLRALFIAMLASHGRWALSQSGSEPEHPAVQGKAAQSALTTSKNQFGIWTGYSPFSFVLKGTTKDRELFLINLQYARTLLGAHALSLRYLAEAVPVALEFQPTQRYVVNGKIVTNPAGAVYGAGANPIGVQANFGHKAWQPFGSGTLGFLYFHQQVPVPGSSQFNYTISVGFGMQTRIGYGRSLTFGWKYHHLSNNYQAHLNPGIDSGVFYVGYVMSGRKRE